MWTIVPNKALSLPPSLPHTHTQTCHNSSGVLNERESRSRIATNSEVVEGVSGCLATPLQRDDVFVCSVCVDYCSTGLVPITKLSPQYQSSTYYKAIPSLVPITKLSPRPLKAHFHSPHPRRGFVFMCKPLSPPRPPPPTLPGRHPRMLLSSSSSSSSSFELLHGPLRRSAAALDAALDAAPGGAAGVSSL